MNATPDRRAEAFRAIRAESAKLGMRGRASYQWRMAEAEVELADAEAAGRIRFRWEYDDDYNPFDMTDQEEDAKLEERRIQSGQWMPYRVLAEVKCECCGHWDEKASLHGIVLAEWGDGTEYNAAERRMIEQDLASKAGVIR